MGLKSVLKASLSEGAHGAETRAQSLPLRGRWPAQRVGGSSILHRYTFFHSPLAGEAGPPPFTIRPKGEW